MKSTSPNLRLPGFLTFLLLLLAPVVWASDSIEALQQPTWVVADGQRSAAFPGQTLGSRDTLITGERGKAQLRLAEGSLVKLGNHAELERDSRGVDRRQASNDSPDGLYEGALKVLEGAFRFTTTALGDRFSREVSIEAGPVATIGIRGTDVWGRADARSSFVALIEGNISIRRLDGSELRLDQPLSVFSADMANPRGDVSQVELEDVLALAPETELDAGQGVLVEDGPYAVHLMSFARAGRAERARQRLLGDGYAVSLAQVAVKGRDWQRLSVRGFASLEDAQSFRDQALDLGLAEQPWVDNNR